MMNIMNIQTIQCESDADLKIVKTAASLSFDNPVAVIGEDTDLLALMCYHMKLD